VNTWLALTPASGHVDLHATLALLSSLKHPPRCSLLTHFNQHEGENAIANSMGSLIAHTHALAPHLAVRWAYPGMVVSSRALPPRNPVMLLDPETNTPCGVAEKTEAHKRRLLHASVILLVAIGQGELLLYRRHPRQSYANRQDTFGGHVQPEDGIDPLNAAVREFNEEVRMSVSERRIAAHASFLSLVGEPYSLLADEKQNLERSSLVAARIPAGFEIKAFDETDTGEEVELHTEKRSFSELLAMYARAPATFADGLGRVLQTACRDEHFRDNLRAVLE
jgi:8-oxo-dGTP pyrophosphatase MutT (NUDIX family)